MISEKTWEPTQEDINWQISQVRLFKEGGAWIVPGSMSVFKIYESKKKAELAIGSPSKHPNPRIIKVFEAMGWEVETRYTASSPE